MKKYIKAAVVLLLPYFLVMASWYLSFGGFNYQQVVTSDTFYMVLAAYDLLFGIIMAGTILVEE